MADPLNPFGNPFGPTFGQLPNPFAQPKPPAMPLPDLSPEQQSSLLGRVGEESLGGLAYLGKLLDKLTFARPVRGLLGGRPEEALSFLPFSDTLGLTRERDVVHGTDLLEQAGLLTPGDDSFENLAAGVAAEIFTDPATLTGGAFVKPLLKGYGKAAQYAGKGLGKATEYATGGRVNPYTFGGKVAERTGRQAGALFDRTAQGATSVGGQALSREVYTPALDAATAAARGDWADPLVDLHPFVTGPGRSEGALLDALRTRAEGFVPEAEATLRGMGYTDPDLARIYGTWDPFAARVKGTQDTTERLGGVGGRLDDTPDWVKAERQKAADLGQPDPYPDYPVADYWPRQLADYEGGTFKGRVGRLTGGGPHAVEREDFLRGIPGGTATIQAWSRNPGLTGADRTLNDLQAKHEIVQQLVAGGNATHPAYNQAEQISDYLFGLDPRVRQTGLYSDDVLGAGLGRIEQEAAQVASEATLMEGIKRFARPLADLQAAGVRAVPVPSFLAKTKFTGDPAQQKAATLLGLNPTTAGGVDQMRAFGIPEDVAADMLRMGEAVKTPAVLAPVVAAWDWALNLFKTSLTTIFPAFHVRNMMSGLFNMWRDGALSGAALDQSQKLIRGGGLYPEVAAKLFPGLPLEQANREFLKEVIANKVAFVRGSRQTSDVTGAAGLDRMLPSQVPEVGGAVRGVGQDLGTFGAGLVPNKGKFWEEIGNPLNQAGVNREEDVNRLVGAGRKVGNTTEDFTRLGHYIAKRQAGASVEDATAAVYKYQINYEELAGFEKAVMKRVMPWYCMPTDHEILTRDGFKLHSQLEVGEEVLAYDVPTGELKWTPLLEVAEFDYDGDLMVFECRGARFEFTENHRWPVESVPNTPGLKARGRRAAIVESHELNSMHRIPLTGEYKGTESVLSPRHAAILGWVITDGSMRWPSPNNCEMVIYQSEKKHLDTVRNLLGVEPQVATDDRQSHKVYTFGVSREDVDIITDHVGRKQDVPEVATRLSAEAAEAMYQAMMAAEGCEIKTTGVMGFAQSAKNYHVRDTFQIVCMLTGRAAFQSKMGCYVRKTKHIWPKHWSRPKVRYAGKIWCPRTAYGTWVVRHGGAVAITGNTYSRRSLPVVLEDLVNRPAKLAGAVRATTGMRDPYEYVPDFVGEGASVAIPGAPEGSQRYITSFGLPFEDEAIKTLASGLQGDVGRVGQQLFGMAVPWLKVPAEVATGTQMFSGRRLEDLRPYEFMTAGGLVPEDLARQASQVVANTPFSRLASSADKLIDDRKGALPTFLNLGTGIRVSDVDEEKMREVAAREALKDALRGTPGVRVREDVYVPKELQGQLNPYQLDLLAVLKAQERKVAEQQKARQAAGGR